MNADANRSNPPNFSGVGWVAVAMRAAGLLSHALSALVDQTFEAAVARPRPEPCKAL
jgi:hypothetical protein